MELGAREQLIKLSFFFFFGSLGLRCFVPGFFCCSKLGVLFIAVCGLLIVLASSVAERQTRGVHGSVAVGRLSCSVARKGVFLTRD